MLVVMTQALGLVDSKCISKLVTARSSSPDIGLNLLITNNNNLHFTIQLHLNKFQICFQNCLFKPTY